jgi:hypothetical protein
VLEQERLKDRQSRGRRDSYPIFAGITLDKRRSPRSPAARRSRSSVGIEELERAFFIADVVDLETGEVLLRGQRAWCPRTW